MSIVPRSARATSIASSGKRSFSICFRTRSSSRSRAKSRSSCGAQGDFVDARRAGHRDRHSQRRHAARLRALSPRQKRARPHVRGQRHRAVSGAGAGEAPRRHDRRRERARTRQRLHGVDPAGSTLICSGSVAARPVRSRRPACVARPTSTSCSAGHPASRAPRRQGPSQSMKSGSCWPTTTPTCANTSRRMLRERYQVEAVADGVAALASARREKARSGADRRDDAAARRLRACCVSCAPTSG